MSIPQYDAGTFGDIASTPLAQSIWKFLHEHDNLVRLELASELHHPAVEGVVTRLEASFGHHGNLYQDRYKQMIGHMVRQVMGRIGYHLDGQGLKVKRGALFNKASRYKKD